MSDIRQFKLSTGEEIICQILEWGGDDEEEVDLVVRYVYRVYSMDDDSHGYRFYSLKPWMTMQEGDGKFITINTMHIVSQAKPDLIILKQFKKAIESSEIPEEDLKDKVADYIEKMRTVFQDDDFDDDEDEESNNIVHFPKNNKDTLH